MENKKLLYFVLSFIFIWSAYNVFFVSDPEDKVEIKATKSTVSATDKYENKIISYQPPKESDLIEIESDSLLIKFDKKIGSIYSVDLKKYTENNDKINIYRFQSQPLFYIDELAQENLVFESNIKENYVLNDDETLILEFASNYKTSEIINKFIIKSDSYVIENDFTFTELSNLNSLKLNFSFPDTDVDNDLVFTGPTLYANGDLVEIKSDDLKDQLHSYNFVDWIAYQYKYFAIGILPSKAFESITVSKIDNSIKYITDLDSVSDTSFNFSSDLYFGPKDVDYLNSVGSNFQHILNFGFFSILAKPLLASIKFIYSIVGNYGFAIIAITVLIKLFFWPLTNKSYSSMKSMQKLQPEMQKIREKFKNDKEKLNKEIMNLYKENRVNPLGGCLPMIVQIPVFFALYKVLMVSIELRQAPFIFHITDLSVKDPYYITPLIMGLTMFIQQKMSPTNLDPMQAKVMLIMPVVFTFMFLNFPSGLVLYWLVNNILTIGQQYYINNYKN